MCFICFIVGIKLAECLQYSKEMYKQKITTAELCAHFNPALIISQVMPSYVCQGWRVKKPFSELLPEMDAQGERRELSGRKKRRKVKQCEIEWRQIKVMEDERRKKDTEDCCLSEL